MVAANTNLQLLLPNDILLWPVAIVFPATPHPRQYPQTAPRKQSSLLGDLTRLDDALELLYDERADPHYSQ